MHKNLGWDTARAADPWALWDIPHHRGSCSACKAEGRRKVGRFGMMVFVFPNNCYKWWSPALLEMADDLMPAHGKQWINSLCCFACVGAFAFPIKLSSSQLTRFLAFSLLILSHPTGESESFRRPGCQLGLNNNSLSGTIHGAQSVWDNDRLDWNVLDWIYNSYFCSANNHQAPVTVMGLTCWLCITLVFFSGYFLLLLLAVVFCSPRPALP